MIGLLITIAAVPITMFIVYLSSHKKEVWNLIYKRK